VKSAPEAACVRVIRGSDLRFWVVAAGRDEIYLRRRPRYTGTIPGP